MRVLYSREDVVRMGPKRPPIAACARARGDGVEIEGVNRAGWRPRVWPAPVRVDAQWREVDVVGPPVGPEFAAGLAEQAMLVAGTLGRNVDVLTLSSASASFEDGRVHVRLAAGDPLDEVVLRSYAIGAAHMALGFVLSEGLAVDDEGNVHDLTIRSFGILSAAKTPPIEPEIVADDAPPRPASTDAVFGAGARRQRGLLTAVPIHCRFVPVEPIPTPDRAARRRALLAE